MLTESHHIPYEDHPSQFGVLRMPKLSELSPVIITIHGGFWQSKYGLEENTPLDEDLTRRGYATWNIEYRRVGEDGGSWQGTFMVVLDVAILLRRLGQQLKLIFS